MAIDREKLKREMNERQARIAAGESVGRGRRRRGKSSGRAGTAVEFVALPPPYTLGAPARFKEWRTGQAASVLRVVDCKKRAIILCLPTGAGKSLTYMVGAALHINQIGGGRVAVLTSTKLLMDQLNRDMKEMGVVDIRGLTNYGCKAMNPGGDLRREMGFAASYYNCEDGVCHGGIRCELKKAGCEYYDRWREARRAPIVLTNYAKWFAELESKEKNEWESAGREGSKDRMGLGEFDVLILDEAHEAELELCSWLSIELKEEECKKIELDTTILRTADGWTQERWSEWAGQEYSRLQSRLEAESFAQRTRGARDTGGGVKLIRELKAMARKMEKIAGIKGRWITETRREESGKENGRGERGERGRLVWRFDPIWATDYAERYLLQQIPKVVLSSATARLKTGELLGLKSQDVELYEQDSTFPVERRPVIHVKCVQMNYRNENDEEVRRWIVGKIDKIINARLDRKGIIHTKSYKRRNYVLSGSRWGKRTARLAPSAQVRQEQEHSSETETVLLWHERHDVRTVVEKFKLWPPPLCLISPSVSTGHDFAYEACEYNVIMKIPFPDTRDKVVEARCKEDKEYGPYVASQELVQMAGRGMRAEDDLCETIIIDDNVQWFVRKYEEFFPEWFLMAYRSENVIPAPPVKLER